MRRGVGPRRQQSAWVRKDRRGGGGARGEPAQTTCASQEPTPDNNVAAFAAAIVGTLVGRPLDMDAGCDALCADRATEDAVALDACDTDKSASLSTANVDDSDETTVLDRAEHVSKADGDQLATPGKNDRVIASPDKTNESAVCRYSRAPSSTDVLAGPKERQRFTDALVAALVERPYGLTFGEVARLATSLSGVRCTGHDARLLIRDIPRETVVVRRMMTPWFVPRVAVALGTRIALERVVAPAVAHVLYTCSNGIDLQRLDVTVFARTGTSLRVHAANYAGGSLRGVLSFVPQVVGRVEKIAQRVVVYPAGHARDVALFEPLDDRTDKPNEITVKDDVRVSRAARCDVTLVSTIEAAANACAEVISSAIAKSCADAAAVVDCRGPIGGRQARGPPVGMLQLVAAWAPNAVNADPNDHAPPQRVYQFDMVALHAEWMGRELGGGGGPVGDPPTFFHAIGIADLLADNRLVKIVFDSRTVSQTFWRCASCPMTRVFDMRLATLALGVGVAVPWSDNDTLASMGSVIDADMHELDAMVGTDAWAWHRRPLPLRARGAAARQVTELARAYQSAVAMHEATQSDDTPLSSVDADHAPAAAS